MRKWREEWNGLSKGIRGLMWHINKLDEYEESIEGLLKTIEEQAKEYIESLEKEHNTISELKNSIERQEILIEKLKGCGNCKHQGVVEWCNLREEFIHTIGYGEEDCVWKPKEDNV